MDLATQSAHVNIDKVRFWHEIIVPYLFQKGCPRQQVVTPLHHVFEQLKLAWPQVDRTVTALRSPFNEIKLQRSHAQHGLIEGWQPEQTPSARYQFNDGERLACGIVASDRRAAHALNHLFKCARQSRLNFGELDMSGLRFRRYILDDQTHQDG